MPPTAGYSFGGVVLVPFPFTDQSGTKKRLAVVVNSAQDQASRRDLGRPHLLGEGRLYSACRVSSRTTSLRRGS
jgi:hypothetical protein